MTGFVGVILKKIFSLALIFNALVTIAIVSGMLFGFYRSYPYWQPYSPYLLDGNLFWLAIAAALINIYPSAAIGRTLHTGRFLFHHYVYGLLVLVLTSILVIIFIPIPLPSLFLVESSGVAVNASRVFFLGGLALLIDDLPDASTHIERCLNRLKMGAFRIKGGLYLLQFLTGCFALYCGVSMFLDTVGGSVRAIPNSFGIVSLLLTSITSFIFVKRKAWLNLAPPNPKQISAFD